MLVNTYDFGICRGNGSQNEAAPKEGAAMTLFLFFLLWTFFFTFRRGSSSFHKNLLEI